MEEERGGLKRKAVPSKDGTDIRTQKGIITFEKAGCRSTPDTKEKVRFGRGERGLKQKSQAVDRQHDRSRTRRLRHKKRSDLEEEAVKQKAELSSDNPA